MNDLFFMFLFFSLPSVQLQIDLRALLPSTWTYVNVATYVTINPKSQQNVRISVVQKGLQSTFYWLLQQNSVESVNSIIWSWSSSTGYSASILTKVAQVDLSSTLQLWAPSVNISATYQALPDHDSMNSPSVMWSRVVVLHVQVYRDYIIYHERVYVYIFMSEMLKPAPKRKYFGGWKKDARNIGGIKQKQQSRLKRYNYHTRNPIMDHNDITIYVLHQHFIIKVKQIKGEKKVVV